MPSPTRRVVVTEFISLDGVIDTPSWTAPYWNDEIAAFKSAEMASAEALLLGRVTYEGFAAAWPSSTDDGAAEMNAIPKHVATTTLTQADLDRTAWNARRLDGDVAEAVRALRAEPGGDLLVYGSAHLVRTLLGAGLVDELRLLVYPVVLGEGKRLFETEQATLDLVEARPVGSGVTALVYRPAAE
ncbi:MAG TPA: dihydrofolate reductase family protein [Rubricoccaceae bacterium]|jgi:dihydrofolate reductase